MERDLEEGCETLLDSLQILQSQETEKGRRWGSVTLDSRAALRKGQQGQWGVLESQSPFGGMPYLPVIGWEQPMGRVTST